MKFDSDMNILNLVIDKESEKILDHLADLLKTRPNYKQYLVNNIFGKN